MIVRGQLWMSHWKLGQKPAPSRAALAPAERLSAIEGFVLREADTTARATSSSAPLVSRDPSSHPDRRTSVGLGSYVVNTSACIDCHSHPTYSPGGDPFRDEPERQNAEEYLSGGRQFRPEITSANITPDSAGRPAGLTRREFIQMMRTGHKHKDPPGLHAHADQTHE
jgi:hypothetical protein